MRPSQQWWALADWRPQWATAKTQQQLIIVMKEYRQTRGCRNLEQYPSFRRDIYNPPPQLPPLKKQQHCKDMSERQLWSVGLIWPEDNKIVTFYLSWLLVIGVSQNKLHLQVQQVNSHCIEVFFFLFRFIGRQFILITWKGNYF